jgi:hypothetical protein
MRFYNQAHRFYGGVGPHARTMYVCVLNQAGSVVFDGSRPAAPDAVRETILKNRSPSAVRAVDWRGHIARLGRNRR